MTPPCIETFNLTKIFPAERGWKSLFLRQPAGRPAVDQVSLSIQPGELFGLLGPNGAGKTTLIKMLSTLVLPTSGQACVNGFSLQEDRQVRSSIGLATSDERSFFWRLSGQANLEFFARLYGLPNERLPDRIHTVLEQTGLLEDASRRFQAYSTGMRQRLGIARALLNEPDVLFLDEPTRGLDPTITRQFHKLILSLSRQAGLTILLTTHNLEEAQALCDRIAVMKAGRIIACGSLPDLRRQLNLNDLYRFQTGSLPASVRRELEARLPGLRVREDAISCPGVNTVEIDLDPSQPGGLQAALDAFQAQQVPIASIDHQPASLETIFTHLIEQPERAAPFEGERPTETQFPQGPTKAPTRRAPRPAPAIPWWKTALAFLKRDFRNESSYRLNFLLQLANIIFSVVVFYFIARLLGPAAAPYLADYGGDYFAFVLIGIAFTGYFGTGLASFAGNLRTAQTTGTLEAMLATPTSLSAIILASSLWDYLLTTLRIVVYLAVGVAFLRVDLSNGNYPAAVLVLLLSALAFSSLGILAAGFILVLKRGDPLTWAVNMVFNLFGGVYFPILILPAWLQLFSRLLPITYALEALRQALLKGASLASLLPDLLALALFSLLLLPLSLLAFRAAVHRAKLDGSLTQY